MYWEKNIKKKKRQWERGTERIIWNINDRIFPKLMSGIKTQSRKLIKHQVISISLPVYVSEILGAGGNSILKIKCRNLIVTVLECHVNDDEMSNKMRIAKWPLILQSAGHWKHSCWGLPWSGGEKSLIRLAKEKMQREDEIKHWWCYFETTVVMSS